MAKIGDKFVLEIEEIYDTDIHNGIKSPAKLYRMKGFNSLVFDENGLHKLQTYKTKNEGDVYEIGFRHGIASMYSTMKDFIRMYLRSDNKQLSDYFGVNAKYGENVLDKIFAELSSQEFMDRVNHYYERIIIGDEIRNVDTKDKMYVIYIDYDSCDKTYYYYGMAETNGDETFVNFNKWRKDQVEKTGKHNETVEKGLIQAFEEILKYGEE